MEHETPESMIIDTCSVTAAGFQTCGLCFIMLIYPFAAWHALFCLLPPSLPDVPVPSTSIVLSQSAAGCLLVTSTPFQHFRVPTINSLHPQWPGSSSPRLASRQPLSSSSKQILKLFPKPSSSSLSSLSCCLALLTTSTMSRARIKEPTNRRSPRAFRSSQRERARMPKEVENKINSS
ncbi:hypothetical protein EV356DRAFT_579237 [Viridothelium virens]|uniref:Uncharacterized protein n=1 Tax=Viridothelium virens TaxID=1048519 RepID=A0A6A6H026_VIRVR|nr:hypothetical protein EV356DRAFT_579237 [Viridothelium virens]